MSLLASFRYRNFRLFIFGQFVSLIGTWMQQLAVSWLAYRLTQSSFWLGVVTFATQIPTLLFGAFAGVIVDRVNRQKLLILIQILFAIQAIILAWLTLTGRITLIELIVLGFLAGILSAFDMPVRQSFTLEMIGEKKDLANAIALNSSVMNGTRLIGPAIAGFLVANVGEGICFLLNALSFLAVIAALLSMRNLHKTHVHSSDPWLKSLKAGIHAAFDFNPIATMLILISVISLFGLGYNTLFPQFAAQILRGDAHTLGLLTSATGLGAFTSALYLAARKDILRLGQLIGVGACIFGLSLIAFGLSTNRACALAAIFVTGFSMMLQLASCNTLIQSLVTDEVRGRVLSIYILCMMGISPFGSLLMGGSAERIGLPKTLILGGSICSIAGIWFLSKRKLMSQQVLPFYDKLGLISETGRDDLVF